MKIMCFHVDGMKALKDDALTHIYLFQVDFQFFIWVCDVVFHFILLYKDMLVHFCVALFSPSTSWLAGLLACCTVMTLLCHPAFYVTF